MILSKRLSAIASYVYKDAKLADICCDHAYIPIYLLKKNIIKYAVASDLRIDPILSAIKNRDRLGISEKQLHLKVANGFDGIKPSDINVAIISGVGGSLAVHILDQGYKVACECQRLIISPNRAPYRIREWACENGFYIKDESVVFENNVFYEIIVLDKGQIQDLSVNDIHFGPILMQRQDEITSRYYKNCYLRDHQLVKKLEQLNKPTDATRKKVELFKKLWKDWNEEKCQFQ